MTEYGKFRYREIQSAPEALAKLKIKPVYIPRQDGCIEHYAFLDTEDDSEVFSCGDLGQLVKEAYTRLQVGG